MDSAILSEMIETRRRLHQHPEEGWTEFETTWLVYNRLKALGCESVLTGTRLINPDCVLGRSEALVEKAVTRAIAAGVPAEFIEKIEGYTGAAAVIDTGRPGPVLALRFDMDALCVEETTDPEHLPNKQDFCSQYAGLMHACGHDAHTALGLAVARWIMENRERLTGVIKLIFQPAEEGVRGANAIVGSGFVDDVDVILASHCGGAIKSKHAGKSALLAACSTCLQMAGIPRHGDGATRVSLGKLNAGEGRNITPAHAYIQAEVRGQTTEINDFLCRNVEHIVKGNAEAYQVQYELERVGEATTIVSCPDILEVIGDVARQTEGVADVVELRKPSGSEDYSLMLKRVVERGGRGAMFRWGCRHHGHHKSDFDIQDTETMPVAFGIFTGCVLRFNGIDSGATD